MDFDKLKNKKTLLMSCCAPCSVALTHTLKNLGIDFSVMFYNPNIFPLTEYEIRKNENKKLCEKLNIPFFDMDWNHQDWLNEIHGFEKEPERGERCSKCFAFRIKIGSEFAKQNNFDALITSFGISRYKSQEQVNKSAQPYINDLFYFNSDLKYMENERYNLDKSYNFYHQKYCGCEFSETFKKKIKN